MVLAGFYKKIIEKFEIYTHNLHKSSYSRRWKLALVRSGEAVLRKSMSSEKNAEVGKIESSHYVAETNCETHSCPALFLRWR